MATSVDTCTEIKLPVSDDEDKRVELVQRAQWLRAAILGANDGLLSVTALMLGVGAAKDDQGVMVISGVAGALAGACSMAVGEFVSVSTQRDIERTTRTNIPVAESVNIQELVPNEATSAIFSPPRSPFMKIIARDALENTIKQSTQGYNADGALPNPYKASGASGLAFLCGSLVPILSALVFSHDKITRIVAIVVVTSIALALFGAAGARFGGSPVRVSAVRVLVGGWISMAVTYALLMPLDRDKQG